MICWNIPYIWKSLGQISLKPQILKTEHRPAWVRFPAYYPEGLLVGRRFVPLLRGGQGDGCRKTKWLAGKRGDNLGFLGLCQSSPADRMATAEGPCCEGGCSFLLKGKRGAPSQALHALHHISLQPLLIAWWGLFQNFFLKTPSYCTHIRTPRHTQTHICTSNSSLGITQLLTPTKLLSRPLCNFSISLMVNKFRSPWPKRYKSPTCLAPLVP